MRLNFKTFVILNSFDHETHAHTMKGLNKSIDFSNMCVSIFKSSPNCMFN